MDDLLKRWGPILAALGIGAGGTTGAVNGLDLMGVHSRDKHIASLEQQLDEYVLECRKTVDDVTTQCRDEIEWLRERCE